MDETELLGIDWIEIGHILTQLIIISSLFEVALATIYKWGVWHKYLEGKGFKIPVAINFALCLTWVFNIDTFAQILNAIGYTAKPHPIGYILTAMLIVGGAGGINELLKKWGIRSPFPKEAKREPKNSDG